MEDHDTGFHDHDLSGGAVGVVAGAVREDRLVLGGGTVEPRGRAPASRSRSARPTSTACCTRATCPPSRSTPYSPPLWRMGAYEVADSGELRRHSVSYAEELRPRSEVA